MPKYLTTITSTGEIENLNGHGFEFFFEGDNWTKVDHTSALNALVECRQTGEMLKVHVDDSLKSVHLSKQFPSQDKST